MCVSGKPVMQLIVLRQLTQYLVRLLLGQSNESRVPRNLTQSAALPVQVATIHLLVNIFENSAASIRRA